MSIQLNSRSARHPLVTERGYGVGRCQFWGSRLKQYGDVEVAG